MLTLTSLTIMVRWEYAGSGGNSFAGNSRFAFAEMKLVRVDLTSLVTVDLASNEAVDQAWHLAVNLASQRIGRGVLHLAQGVNIQEHNT